MASLTVLPSLRATPIETTLISATQQQLVLDETMVIEVRVCTFKRVNIRPDRLHRLAADG